jgi:hypothetical protein
MSTAELDLQEQADSDAVMRHAFEGAPLDPEVARRVRERARRVTEEIYRLHGEIPEETLNQALREVRDDI